uniref:Putative membrane protein n=1 Tax=Loigolactobacillus rennini TaxID=238013 RepID=A0A1K2I3V1_9LACO|nr:putative membrane protein [Loigolactobacillus rennini]
MHQETTFLKAVIIGLVLVVLGGCCFAIPNIIHIGWQFHNRYSYLFYAVAVGGFITAILFSWIAWQALRLLQAIAQQTVFTLQSSANLHRIKIGTLLMSACYLLELPVLYVIADHADAPGILLIGIILTGAAIVISVFAALLEKLLASALTYKAENDLTI